MQFKLPKSQKSQKKKGFRIMTAVLLFLLIASSTLLIFLIKTKEIAFNTAFLEVIFQEQDSSVAITESFPLGVNPIRQEITENPSVDTFLETHLSFNQKRTNQGWIDHTLAALVQFDWYQNLASPISRILVIESGERKEEVARNFGNILRWNSVQRSEFLTLIAESSPKIDDGKFFPDHYVVNKDATPKEVATLINQKFGNEVLSRYTPDISKIVPLNDALTIASLLEREAYDFDDMRYISGIIWNRLFVGMNLQLDASLQYAKANQSGNSWWPVVLPADKFITSPFNTYKNKGLPPSPISNPSVEAILAALNPKNTTCLFYFHDSNGGFHCTATYQEHVALLKQYYGRGK